ncbi:MAG TPA: hypothetical protein VJ742_12585 [Nitrososphaera sp.]|nr:hypothetical protein [Nitrososphaera sp.]
MLTLALGIMFFAMCVVMGVSDGLERQPLGFWKVAARVAFIIFMAAAIVATAYFESQ